MKSMHQVLCAGALAVALAGCGIGVRAPQHYHVLAPAPASPPASARLAAVDAPALLVTPTTADAFYEGQAIAYSMAPGRRAHYQLNQWTESPSHTVGKQLAERLRRAAAFSTVVTSTGGVRGALVLDTHIDEIYHDAAGGPGSARITLTVSLSDPSRRVAPAQRRFSASAPAPTRDAAGAVQAFDAALGPLLDEVVAWAGQAAMQARPPARIAVRPPQGQAAADS